MIQLDAFDATRLKTARDIVRDLGSVLVAYSGGVDSTLLLRLAMDELGHGAVLRRLGLRPLLDLDLRLGEGTGAVLALPLLDAAVNTLLHMATFNEAGVSERQEDAIMDRTTQ